VAAADVVHDDLAHGLRGGSEEVPRSAPGRIFIPGELQPGLVNEGGALKGLTRRKAG
jgi:hypothetical protein